MAYCFLFFRKSLRSQMRIVGAASLISIYGLVYAQVTEFPPLKEPKPKETSARDSKAIKKGLAPKQSSKLSPPVVSRRNGIAKPDISRASQGEQKMIENACGYDRRNNGPAAYYNCLKREMRELASVSVKPDISRASQSEQKMIANACGYDRRNNGPAAYYNCLKREMRELASVSAKPDISRASQSEQKMIANACGYDRRNNGPATYYNCLKREMRELGY